MTDMALPSGAMSEDFFHRARTRLSMGARWGEGDAAGGGARSSG